MRNRLLIALPATVALVALVACGTGARTVGDGELKVVAAFYPLAWLAERVGGPSVGVTNLTKPGAEPHDLELTPRQVIEVGEARLVFYLKGVQPAVDEAIEQHARKHSLDAATVVSTLPAPRGGESEGHSLGYDPHVWLDPHRFATIATALGERLAKTDPGHGDDYRSRALDVVSELDALDRRFRQGLARCDRKVIVTGHAAFGYLADRYGLTQQGVSGLDPHTEPSPERIVELTELVERTGTTTIFTETPAGPKTAKVLADEAGVRTAVLDPVEGVRPGSHDDYLSLMRRDLSTLRSALGCS